MGRYSASLDLGEDWKELYPMLFPLARRLVFSFRVPSWKGQEEDIIEDIVQETMLRVLNYFQRAEDEKVPSVHSRESMSIRIAYNYCNDLRRREPSFVSLAPYGDDHYPYADLLRPLVSSGRSFWHHEKPMGLMLVVRAHCGIGYGCDGDTSKHQVSILKGVDPLNKQHTASFCVVSGKHGTYPSVVGERDILGEVAADTS